MSTSTGSATVPVAGTTGAAVATVHVNGRRRGSTTRANSNSNSNSSLLRGSGHSAGRETASPATTAHATTTTTTTSSSTASSAAAAAQKDAVHHRRHTPLSSAGSGADGSPHGRTSVGHARAHPHPSTNRGTNGGGDGGSGSRPSLPPSSSSSLSSVQSPMWSRRRGSGEGRTHPTTNATIPPPPASVPSGRPEHTRQTKRQGPQSKRDRAGLALDALQQDNALDEPPMTTATATPSPSIEYCQQQQQPPRDEVPGTLSPLAPSCHRPSSETLAATGNGRKPGSAVTSKEQSCTSSSLLPSDELSLPPVASANSTTRSSCGSVGVSGALVTPTASSQARRPSSTHSGDAHTAPDVHVNGSAERGRATPTSLPCSPSKDTQGTAHPTVSSTTKSAPSQQHPSRPQPAGTVSQTRAELVSQLYKSVAGAKPQEALPRIIDHLKSQQPLVKPEPVSQAPQAPTPPQPSSAPCVGGKSEAKPPQSDGKEKNTGKVTTLRAPPAPPATTTTATAQTSAKPAQPTPPSTANSHPSTPRQHLVQPPPPPPPPQGPTKSAVLTLLPTTAPRTGGPACTGSSENSCSSLVSNPTPRALMPPCAVIPTTTTAHSAHTANPSLSVGEDSLLSPLPTAIGMASAFQPQEAPPTGSGQLQPTPGATTTTTTGEPNSSLTGRVPRKESPTALRSTVPSPGSLSLQAPATYTSTGSHGATLTNSVSAAFLYPSVFASRSGRGSPQNTPYTRNGLVPTFTATNTNNNVIGGSCQTLPLEECSRSDISSMFSINSVDLQEFIYEFRMAKEAVVNDGAATAALDDEESDNGTAVGNAVADRCDRDREQGVAHSQNAAADGSRLGRNNGDHHHHNDDDDDGNKTRRRDSAKAAIQQSCSRSEKRQRRRDEITIEELALILDRVAFPVPDMALLSDLFDELSMASEATTVNWLSSDPFHAPQQLSGSANSTGAAGAGTGNALFPPAVRGSLIAAAVSRSASSARLASLHCTPASPGLANTTPGTLALGGSGGYFPPPPPSRKVAAGAASQGFTTSSYHIVTSPAALRSPVPLEDSLHGRPVSGTTGSMSAAAAAAQGHHIAAAAVVGQGQRHRNSFEVACEALHNGETDVDDAAVVGRGARLDGGATDEPTVDFEAFLARMAFKIQGRYPTEVMRYAFLRTVDAIAHRTQDRHQSPQQPARIAGVDNGSSGGGVRAAAAGARMETLASSSVPTTATPVSDDGINAWANRTAAQDDFHRHLGMPTSMDGDTEERGAAASEAANPQRVSGGSRTGETACSAATGDDGSANVAIGASGSSRPRSAHDSSSTTATSCTQQPGGDLSSIRDPHRHTSQLSASPSPTSVSTPTDLASTTELPCLELQRTPVQGMAQETTEGSGSQRGVRSRLLPSAPSTDSLAAAVSDYTSPTTATNTTNAFAQATPESPAALGMGGVYGHSFVDYCHERGLSVPTAAGPGAAGADVTALLDNVPLRDCLTLGVQRFLGFRDFNGAEAQQALRKAGLPDTDLGFPLHLNDFIRLVHALTAVVYGTVMSGTPGTASVFGGSPAVTSVPPSSSFTLLASPKPPTDSAFFAAATVHRTVS